MSIITLLKLYMFCCCAGVAYTNNKVSQKRIAEENAIPALVGILNDPMSEEVQVEVAISLGCIILGNSPNQEKLQDCDGFKFDVLLDLLKSHNEVCMKYKVEFSFISWSYSSLKMRYAYSIR